MGSLYDDDDEEFDLAAVEARHEELEALEALDTREGWCWIFQAVRISRTRKIRMEYIRKVTGKRLWRLCCLQWEIP